MLGSMRGAVLLRAVFSICFCACLVAGGPSYLLTCPNTLQVGHDSKCCITFHNVYNDIDASIYITDTSGNNTYFSIAQVFKNGNGGCFTVNVPATVTSRSCVLNVDGFTVAPSHQSTHYGNHGYYGDDDDDDDYGYGGDDGHQSHHGHFEDYHFYGNATLSLRRSSVITFIQTDKPIYQPGQLVQFRILSVDRDLKPDLGKISQVFVQNPNKVRIAQWVNSTTQSGIGDFKLQLTSEPVLGKWKITAKVNGKTTTQEFTVDEFVLPKFEVIATPPKFVAVNQDFFSVNICAKYTFGKSVRGTVTAKACLSRRFFFRFRRRRSIRPQPQGTCKTLVEPINGCVNLTFASADVSLSSSRYSFFSNIKFDVKVEEAQTGIVQNATVSNTQTTRVIFKINLQDRASGQRYSLSYYKPGLPYHGKLRAVKPDGSPATGEIIQVTATSRGTAERFQMNGTTDSQGFMEYSLPPFSDEAKQLSLRFEAPAYKFRSRRGFTSPFTPSAFLSLKRWFSRSNSFIQIEPVSKNAKCGSNLPVKVLFTSAPGEHIEFRYLVMSRGDIVKTGSKHDRARRRTRRYHRSATDAWIELVSNTRPSTTTPAPTDHLYHYEQSSVIDSFNFRVKLIPSMSPVASLVVYYVRYDYEVVADHRNIIMEPCVDNKVSLHLARGKKTVRPGEKTDIEVRASSGSICSVGVVDKSIFILGGDNRLTLEKVFQLLRGFRVSTTLRDFNYCRRKLAELEPEPEDGVRRRRSFFGGFSNYYDAIHAFNMGGVEVLSDAELETRPCDEELEIVLKGATRGVQNSMVDPARPQPEAQNSDSNAVSAEEEAQIRDFFPETFLWDLNIVGSSGVHKQRKAVPDTITSWEGSAFCVSPTAGLGVSAPVSLIVFQAFFASFNLPYSVVRGERVPISVSVFNYLTECLTIKLTLNQENWFTVAPGTTLSTTICICGGDKLTPKFFIKPTGLGSLNLTVQAAVVNDVGVCGNHLKVNSQYIGLKDTVRRPLRVEAEGKETGYARSIFVCPKGGATVTNTLDLSLPAAGTLVPGSARGFFTVIGDVLGPALSGLENLLRLPGGCGEQNMLGFVPNIYVLQYLKATRQASAELEARAKGFMEKGYQNQLKFRRNDNSYSAFGQRDKEGSMWLTAYVAKSFALAKPFIFIDDADVQKSITWFKSKQLENGCFPPVGRVIHKSMKGGLATQGSPAVLTAFVLIAMVESGIGKEDQSVKDAIQCMKAQKAEDIYSIALMTYAMSLADPASPFRAQLMDKLDRQAKFMDGLKYWTEGSQPPPPPAPNSFFRRPYRFPSADVEITAYALMSKLVDQDSGVVAKTLPIVQWLSSQRNSRGGFRSTQDTVIALEALAKFAARIYGPTFNLNVNVQGQGISETLTINPTNSLIQQQRPVQAPNSLTVQTSGSGCCFIQVNVRYNVFTVDTRPSFTIKVTPKREIQGINQCRFRFLEICVNYNDKDGASNMAVVIVKMVTGWVADKEYLKRLLNDASLGLKKYEIENNMLNLYFDELTKDVKCFNVRLEQTLEVGDLKPAIVRVFDYYEKAKMAEFRYELKTLCGTKEEIPFGNNRAANPMEQQRVPMEFPVEMMNRVSNGTGAASLCPTCYDASSVPSNVPELYCAASKAYRFKVRPTRNYPLKALKEFRQKEVKKLHILVKFTLPAGCTCPILNSSGKVLILTKTTNIVLKKKAKNQKGKVTFAQDVTVIPMADPKKLEKSLRKKRRSCH